MQVNTTNEDRREFLNDLRDKLNVDEKTLSHLEMRMTSKYNFFIFGQTHVNSVGFLPGVDLPTAGRRRAVALGGLHVSCGGPADTELPENLNRDQVIKTRLNLIVKFITSQF